jgi:NAD(P)-dependent dehydrogenase (short-subunit alcohol dehydrogenase family)
MASVAHGEAQVAKAYPMGRLGTPADVAGLVAFLRSLLGSPGPCADADDTHTLAEGDQPVGSGNVGYGRNWTPTQRIRWAASSSTE